MTEPTHGGRRVGAGRKPKPEKKIPASMKLSPEVVAFLRSSGNTIGEAAESILRASKPFRDWKRFGNGRNASEMTYAAKMVTKTANHPQT